MTTEFDLIRDYFTGLGSRRDDVRIGVGDDGAVLAPTPGQLLVTATDTLVADVHFPADAPAETVGHKALAVNLSDLAAMGARPAWVQLAITLPRVDEAWIRAFARGFGDLARYHDVSLVGGDTCRGPLSITAQVFGFAGSGQILRRRGARAGDAIVVSGTLGDAALGLRLWRGRADRDDPAVRYLVERLHQPTPRVSLGQALAGRATAAIDLSDGLAADLGHLVDAGQLGAVVDVDRIPVSPAGVRFGGHSSQSHAALVGGDDYELCFTVPRGRLHELDAIASQVGVALTRIGSIQPERGVRYVHGDGTPAAVHGSGYRHFAD